jgi:glycosyltransferase involved in cell wall biosynthesis
MFISAVIPARDAGATLGLLFDSFARSTRRPDEVILVDDGSAEPLEECAMAHGAHYLRLARSRGPAAARNLGASHATGEILLFLDADVSTHPDTIERLASAIESDPRLAAVIGSYDDSPGHTGFWSRYRNLLHAWIHQTASPSASTFWGACGAIRREAFHAAGGFPEVHDRPAIEDIELGCKLVKAHYRIRLDRHALIRHHKAWSFLRMLRTDVFDRAIPWTRLILRERRMPNDLNLRRGQRFTAVLALLMLALLPTLLLAHGFLVLFAVVAAAYVVRNWRFYSFLAHSQGLWFAVRSMPAHWLYFIYSCLGFALGVASHLLAGAPATAAVEQAPRESRS